MTTLTNYIHINPTCTDKHLIDQYRQAAQTALDDGYYTPPFDPMELAYYEYSTNPYDLIEQYAMRKGLKSTQGVWAGKNMFYTPQDLINLIMKDDTRPVDEQERQAYWTRLFNRPLIRLNQLA